MFDSIEKSTGTGYTKMVALLSVAFIFSPGVLFVLRPFGYVALVLAVAVSITCVTLAWANWKKSSQPGLPSIGPSVAAQRERAK
jgi:hypothetical protein